jgi:hypothetical protein
LSKIQVSFKQEYISASTEELGNLWHILPLKFIRAKNTYIITL